jgi:hypothetical protein
MLDRLIFAGLYCLAPTVLGALAIVKPETVIKIAPRRVQIVLAVEVAAPWRPTNFSD